MDTTFTHRLRRRRLTRRDFLWLLSLGSTAFMLPGCAVDPVTGRKQLLLMSEEQEISLDRRHSPQQFSQDYGTCQDRGLNRYIEDVGGGIAKHSHRPHMPYSFRAVNATHVNAYAFPGGSVAVTRGILVELEDEAELAALLGHEIAHVNARHTAERMTKGTFMQLALLGGAGYMRGSDYGNYAPYLEKVGGIGAMALLASYSRDDEREADSLGMEYMVKAGYGPQGMTGLMALLMEKSRHKPSAIELMFSTHPMSQERYAWAGQQAAKYGQYKGLRRGRERYMDQTAGLRRMKDALQDMQDGQALMAAKKYDQAEKSFGAALRKEPQDYAALVMMAKCKMALGKADEARRLARQARDIYPQEAQAVQVSGVARLSQQDYDGAYRDFAGYDRMLPGNSQVGFLKGVCLEGMGKRQDAAQEYGRFLQRAGQGDAAGYARQRLLEWGYVK